MTSVRQYDDLPPSTVRATLIAARVPEIATGVAQDLAIASEQPTARPTIRQRLAAKLKTFVVAEAPAPAAYDAAGYYPVRRTSGRAPANA